MMLLVWPPAEHLWIGRNRGNLCLTAIAARWLLIWAGRKALVVSVKVVNEYGILHKHLTRTSTAAR
jgi:hypothetical protein